MPLLSSRSGTGQKVVMLYSLEGNRRSGITMANRHRLSDTANYSKTRTLPLRCSITSNEMFWQKAGHNGEKFTKCDYIQCQMQTFRCHTLINTRTYIISSDLRTTLKSRYGEDGLQTGSLCSDEPSRISHQCVGKLLFYFHSQYITVV